MKIQARKIDVGQAIKVMGWSVKVERISFQNGSVEIIGAFENGNPARFWFDLFEDIEIA